MAAAGLSALFAGVRGIFLYFGEIWLALAILDILFSPFLLQIDLFFVGFFLPLGCFVDRRHIPGFCTPLARRRSGLRRSLPLPGSSRFARPPRRGGDIAIHLAAGCCLLRTFLHTR